MCFQGLYEKGDLKLLNDMADTILGIKLCKLTPSLEAKVRLSKAGGPKATVSLERCLNRGHIAMARFSTKDSLT